MKFMSTWTVRPGAVKDAVERCLATQGRPAEGVTLLGRWHAADGSGGFTLYESTDPVSAAAWTDLLEVHNVPVVEDAQAGPVLAKLFKT